MIEISIWSSNWLRTSRGFFYHFWDFRNLFVNYWFVILKKKILFFFPFLYIFEFSSVHRKIAVNLNYKIQLGIRVLRCVGHPLQNSGAFYLSILSFLLYLGAHHKEVACLIFQPPVPLRCLPCQPQNELSPHILTVICLLLNHWTEKPKILML